MAKHTPQIEKGEGLELHTGKKDVLDVSDLNLAKETEEGEVVDETLVDDVNALLGVETA